MKLSETAFFDARWLALDSRCCPGVAGFSLTGWKMGGNLGLEVGGCDLKVLAKSGCEVGYPGVLLGGDLGSCGFVILMMRAA